MASSHEVTAQRFQKLCVGSVVHLSTIGRAGLGDRARVVTPARNDFQDGNT
jgi:hypothetical protein